MDKGFSKETRHCYVYESPVSGTSVDGEALERTAAPAFLRRLERTERDYSCA